MPHRKNRMPQQHTGTRVTHGLFDPLTHRRLVAVDRAMTASRLCSTERTTIGEIADMMLRTGIQRIPIVDADAKLIGLVTQTIVIKAARRFLP